MTRGDQWRLIHARIMAALASTGMAFAMTEVGGPQHAIWCMIAGMWIWLSVSSVASLVRGTYDED